MKKKFFDNDKYIRMQSEKIKERIKNFDNKLYLEFGGKIFDDFHASRVLYGFEADTKVKMLKQIKNDVEILIVISANDIQQLKSRGDNGLSYADDVIRLIKAFRRMQLEVGSVVITKYANQPSADAFRVKLTNLGIKTFLHYLIPGYPTNVDYILSEEGFGKNEYIETSHSLIVVTAPGPGSGKMATCLSQLYHENKRGIKAGYAKFETFPIWNLPLKHPINLAYEAATADLNDVNMIDYFHLDAYNVATVNYNRDLEVFPVLQSIFTRIYGSSPYKSPTDMGVNMDGFAIIDDDLAQEASKQEIIRRYLDAKCSLKMGKIKPSTLEKIELIMNQLELSVDNRACVAAALKKKEQAGTTSAAILLHDGTMITGKKTPLFTESSAAVINALKHLAKIDDDLMLISPNIIDPIQKLKQQQLHNKTQRLHLDEVLIALAITATTNAVAQKALEQLPKLYRTQAHVSAFLHPSDLTFFKKLRVDVTCEPNYTD